MCACVCGVCVRSVGMSGSRATNFIPFMCPSGLFMMSVRTIPGLHRQLGTCPGGRPPFDGAKAAVNPSRKEQTPCKVQKPDLSYHTCVWFKFMRFEGPQWAEIRRRGSEYFP